ncbi:hypothetical protein [uncultured Gammaproteobacteria bacterium]|nr:hypothetical protein [uncultured Gammaproteobacteria bacterium]
MQNSIFTLENCRVTESIGNFFKPCLSRVKTGFKKFPSG